MPKGGEGGDAKDMHVGTVAYRGCARTPYLDMNPTVASLRTGPLWITPVVHSPTC